MKIPTEIGCATDPAVPAARSPQRGGLPGAERSAEAELPEEPELPRGHGHRLEGQPQRGRGLHRALRDAAAATTERAAEAEVQLCFKAEGLAQSAVAVQVQRLSEPEFQRLP